MRDPIEQFAKHLVQNEVHLCLSGMVAQLARASGSPTAIAELADQALELALPVLDYEEAARQAGWSREASDGLWTIADGRDEDFTAENAEEACSLDGLGPYEHEVYEHWAVSERLAEYLIRHGERVDTDFAGLNVWARTTTGQAIHMDAVVQDIARELQTALPALPPEG